MRKEHDRLLWRKSDKLTPRPSASPYRWDICHYQLGGADDTAASKIEKLEAAGIPVARLISQVPGLLSKL